MKAINKLILLIPIMLISCSSLYMYNSINKNYEIDVAEDESIIVFYWPKIYGLKKFINLPIEFNGERVGYITNQTYFLISIEPGEYDYLSMFEYGEGDIKTESKIATNPGEIYYFEVDYYENIFYSVISLEQVPNKKGIRKIKNCTDLHIYSLGLPDDMEL